jgi:tRNA wybutosine-synthesizing protein 1
MEGTTRRQHTSGGEERIRELLTKQKYHLVGNHSAVKTCTWLRHSISEGRPCYKQRFYGIATHRCIQMSPTSIYCNLQCLHCWRVMPPDIGITWNEDGPDRWDDPEDIVEGSIREQRRLTSGYKDLVYKERLSYKKFKETQDPKHAAISLTGEPTLYPKIGDLIDEWHHRGFTTFLVTNGTRPDVLEGLENEPTQLYVTLPAPDEETFTSTCRPRSPDSWDQIKRTLSILPSLATRTVIRLTLTRGLNMRDPEGYASLIDPAEPDFIEPKGYVHVGFSRRRLPRSSMPNHTEITRFGERLSDLTGYHLTDEHPDSKVVLLSRREKYSKIGPYS